MKAIFPGIESTHEMIVEIENNKINFWVHDTNDEQASMHLDITFDETKELIKFLQEKLNSGQSNLESSFSDIFKPITPVVHSALNGYALSQAILKDYSESLSKLTGETVLEIKDRVVKEANEYNLPKLKEEIKVLIEKK